MDETGPFLFGGQTKPSLITVDDEYVYWLNETATGFDLQRGPKAGGCPETLRASAIAFPEGGSYATYDMFVDDGGVFIASTNKARALVKFDKQSGTDTFAAECASEGTGVAAQNANNAYFGCTDGKGKILGVAKSNGGNTMSWDSPEATRISGLAASGSWVYFNFENGAVERVSLAGTNAQTLKHDEHFIAVAYGGNAWGLTTTSVWMFPDGTGASLGSGTLNSARDVIATAETAFVLQSGSGSTSVVRLSPPKTYTLPQKSPGGFALDATHLYITDKNPGVISRIQR